MTTTEYNPNNPAIKRLFRELKEMQANPSDQYVAGPLEDNIFEWHFTVRGPRETAFEDGMYHGKIILPAEYPFKPPHVMFLNASGRFELNKKICLSISAYHPEHWQPSWSMRTVLLAIISFMPTRGEGAIGALDYTDEERKILARRSHSFQCSTCNADMASLLSQFNEVRAQRGGVPGAGELTLDAAMTNGPNFNSPMPPTRPAPGAAAGTDTPPTMPTSPTVTETSATPALSPMPTPRITPTMPAPLPVPSPATPAAALPPSVGTPVAQSRVAPGTPTVQTRPLAAGAQAPQHAIPASVPIDWAILVLVVAVAILLLRRYGIFGGAGATALG